MSTSTSGSSDRDRMRREVWKQLRKVAYPDSRFAWDFGSYIPDHEGSEEVAERILGLAERRELDRFLTTPDNNLNAFRERMIEEERAFVMPTYGILRGFVRLQPKQVPAGKADFASTLDGMNRFATPVPLDRLAEDHPGFDCLVTGASFITRDGLRMGKGHGYFDLEWAMLREVGLVDESTLVLAAGHEVQVVAPRDELGSIADSHDTIVDYIVTPENLYEVEDPPPKPEGIFWERLSRKRVEKIPPLKALWERAGNPDLG